MRPASSNTASLLLLKSYPTYKPEEILSVGGTTNHARMKGYSFSVSQFENLPGEPISEEELVKSLHDSEQVESLLTGFLLSK